MKWPIRLLILCAIVFSGPPLANANDDSTNDSTKTGTQKVDDLNVPDSSTDSEDKSRKVKEMIKWGQVTMGPNKDTVERFRKVDDCLEFLYERSFHSNANPKDQTNSETTGFSCGFSCGNVSKIVKTKQRKVWDDFCACCIKDKSKKTD